MGKNYSQRLNKSSHVKAKKRYGQNFLIDQSVLDNIVQVADVNSEDVVLEIGPGTGNLTRLLASYAKEVVAIEIDRDLVGLLEEEFKETKNLKIINTDVLKVSLEDILSEYDKSSVKIVANLPYYITTPILMKILESKLEYKSVTVMVQKEVALRMCACAGTSDYGALSLAVQYYTNPSISFDIPGTSFRPIPKVDSSLVHMEKIPPRLDDAHKKLFFSVVKAAFSQRRKMLANAISNQGGTVGKEDIREILLSLGMEENIRGEMLDMDNFIMLCNKIYARCS